MHQKGTFDSYFNNMPPLEMEYDFNTFWKETVVSARKISVDHEITKNRKKSSLRFAVKNVQFRGFLRTPVHGELVIPSKAKKPNVIIHIHDYNTPLGYSTDLLPVNVAHFFLWLRGHDTLNFSAEEPLSTPGFLGQSLVDKDNYYARAVYVDAIRSIDMLRLQKELDCKSIGFYGKNFGAAVAIAAAAHTERVSGIMLDTPSFCNIPKIQNLSTSVAVNEINLSLEEESRKKKQMKKTLSYFDALNFTPRISSPVMSTVGFKDTISPPETVFALFNHLRCEKYMEIFPEDGNSAGGREQLKKSLQWLADTITD